MTTWKMKIETRPDSAGESRLVVVDADGALVCAVSRREGDHKAAEANANMLASAPAMLNALEDMLNVLRGIREDLPLRDTKNNHERLLFAGDSARAAIAKAKGEV